MSKSQTVEALTPMLNVHDVEASMKFYTEALGFEVANRAPPAGRCIWALLKNGSARIMLNTSERAAGDASAAERRRGNGSFGDAVLYMTVADVDALFHELSARGLSVGTPFDTDYGMREFHPRDHDGYELAFVAPSGS